jgi:hypothetical protein
MIEDDGSVARVTDPGSTPIAPHVCTQLVPVQLQLVIVRPKSGGLQAIVDPFSTPTPGDCAGPLALSLSNFTLPARRLPGPREAYDLSSTQRFGSGPYEVSLKSTIRARRPSGRGNGESGSGMSSGSTTTLNEHKGLVESVSIVYRIATTGGTVTTKFAGRPDPFCVPFDACGANGTLTDAISGLSTQFEFDAQRVVKRRVSRRAALADVRSGRLQVQETGSLLIDVLSADVGWSAGSTCTDRLKQFNSLGVGVSEQRQRRNVLFSLQTDQTEDPLRTACPGPGTADVLGSSDTLARAMLPLRELGRRSLRIAISGRGRFVSGSYQGSHSGGVTFGLRLIRVRAGTKAENVFPGEP